MPDFAAAVVLSHVIALSGFSILQLTGGNGVVSNPSETGASKRGEIFITFLIVSLPVYSSAMPFGLVIKIVSTWSPERRLLNLKKRPVNDILPTNRQN